MVFPGSFQAQPVDLQAGVWNKCAAKSKSSQEEPNAEERNSAGCFSWDVNSPKQAKSLGNSGMEGWMPLSDGRRVLFPGPALAQLQCGHKPRTPCSAPVETDITKPRGWLWEICCSVLFAPNSQVGLPAEMSGSLDSLRAPRERLSGTAACHLLRAGGAEQGTLAALGAAFRHSILHEQQDQASCLTRI